MSRASTVVHLFFFEHQLKKRLQPLNASTNLLRAPTLIESQQQLGESIKFQLLQAPTCRLRHKVSPSTSLPPLFASYLQKNQIKTIKLCLCLPNHYVLLICSASLFCSSSLLLCSFSQVFSAQHTPFYFC